MDTNWEEIARNRELSVKTLWEAFTIFHVWHEKKNLQSRFQHLCSDKHRELEYFVAVMLALKLHHSTFVDVEDEIPFQLQRQQYVYDLERAMFEIYIEHGTRFTLYELAVINNTVDETLLESLCFAENFPQYSLSAQESLDCYCQALSDFQNGIVSPTVHGEEIQMHLEKLLSTQSK